MYEDRRLGKCASAVEGLLDKALLSGTCKRRVKRKRLKSGVGLTEKRERHQARTFVFETFLKDLRHMGKKDWREKEGRPFRLQISRGSDKKALGRGIWREGDPNGR